MLKRLVFLVLALASLNIQSIDLDLLDKIKDLVHNNPGQLTVKEYTIIVEAILKKHPCNVLVFGVGRDSSLWINLNKNGETVFIEDDVHWLKFAQTQNQHLIGYLVKYETTRKQWKDFLNKPSLLELNLPNEIKNKKWDVIIVDGPAGDTDAKPGRMKSIYTAALFAHNNNNVDVFVHDCDRIVEAVYSDKFLLHKNLFNQVGKLRHYIINTNR